MFSETRLKGVMVKTTLTVMKNNGMRAIEQSATAAFHAAICQCKLHRMGNNDIEAKTR